MKKIPPGAFAALLAAMLLAAPPALAGPAHVTVRVEGATQTLVPRSAVTTDTTPVLVDGGNSCSGTSAGGALYKAVAGDLGGSWGDFGFLLERVKGETQTAPPSSDPAPFWSFWVNYESQNQGLCATELQEGDDVLVFADCFSRTGKCSGLTPLRIAGVPATVAPGAAVMVTLDEFVVTCDVNFNCATTPRPAENATVTAAGRTVITGADGTARLTLSAPGPVTIAATKPSRVRTAALTCVTTGGDGSCGSQLPASAVLGTEKADDHTAPVASFSRLENGKVFKHGHGPRKLSGSVTADPSGLLSVRLSILRKTPTGCWAFDGRRERFKPHRCGGRKSFRIGDREEWSYLLPKRLPRGRYTIRAVAIDRAGNDSVTRVVIRVK